MIDILIVFFALIFFSIIGKCIINLFGFLEYSSDLEIIPFAFGLGAFLVAFQLYLYSRFNIHWNTFSIFLPWFIFLSFVFILKRRYFYIRVKRYVRINRVDYFFVFLIILLLLFVAFESILRPVSAWDGWALWLFKAKAFYIDGKVTSNFFTYIPSDYPLVISLVITYFYIILGRINDSAVLLFFFSCYAMLGLACFTQLAKRTTVRNGLIFTFLLLSLQNLIRHGGRFEAGYADLPLAFYIFLSTMLFVNVLKKKDLKTLILLNIFLGITALIKNEGFTFSLIIEIISTYKLVRIRKLKYITCSIFWLLPVGDWWWLKKSYQIPENYIFVNFPQSVHLEKLPLILLEITKEFVKIQNWNLLWIVFIFSFVIYIKNYNKKYVIFYTLVTFQLCVYVVIFLVTATDPILHIKNVIDRLFIHIAPLAIFTIGITQYDKNK